MTSQSFCVESKMVGALISYAQDECTFLFSSTSTSIFKSCSFVTYRSLSRRWGGVFEKHGEQAGKNRGERTKVLQWRNSKSEERHGRKGADRKHCKGSIYNLMTTLNYRIHITIPKFKKDKSDFSFIVRYEQQQRHEWYIRGSRWNGQTEEGTNKI